MERNPKNGEVRHLVTVVIPTYNEESTIIQALRQIEETSHQWDQEVIVSDDGSTDATVKLVAEYSETHPWVSYLVARENKGRGEAVSVGFLEARGDILVFLDADMATDLSHIEELVTLVTDSADICIGSRWLAGSVVARSLLRLFISKAYNVMVGLLFGSPLSDHQCGFKAFRREAALALVRESGLRKDRGWLWDTEMLLRAQAKGLSIVEIPVRWRAGRESKFHWRKDILGGLRYLLGLKRRLKDTESTDSSGL